LKQNLVACIEHWVFPKDKVLVADWATGGYWTTWADLGSLGSAEAWRAKRGRFSKLREIWEFWHMAEFCCASRETWREVL